MSIALIAGTGGLPPHLADSLVEQGRTPIVCEMRGFVSEIEGAFERVGFRIETLGTFLETLKSLHVTEVCMAGAVQRPVVDPNAIDPATAPLLPRLMAAMAKGDDGTLREIVAIFEEQGFAVVGAHEVAPDLLPVTGVHTQTIPADLTRELAAAQTKLAEMGHADQGQAMLLKDGAVLAVEDARGTAAMLQDYYAPLDARGAAKEKSADSSVLFKAPKPDQLVVADMPLIGPETAKQAAQAGLAGIVIPSEVVMVLDLPQVVAILDAQGMFLQVIP